jgi:PAS domain S-box-containing protein
MRADAAAAPAGYEGGRRWRHRRKDGSLLWVEIASHALPWVERPGRLVLALDVTAQVQLEARLRWQADLLARLASGEPLPHLLAALTAFVCEMCQGVLSAIMLVDRQAGVLRPAAGHGVPADVQQAANPTPIRDLAGVCGTAAARRAPVVVEDIEASAAFDAYRAVTRAHGLKAAWSHPFFDAQGQLLGTSAMYALDAGPPTALEADVSRFAATLAGIVVERARALDALHEREARLRAIYDHEPECVKVLDPEGRLIEMNSTGLRLIEAESLEAVRGAAVADLVTPEYRDRFTDLTRRVAAGGDGHLEFEMVGLKGTRRWLETHAAPLRDASGRVTAVLGITRDVSQQKALAAELQQAQKLESVGLLAGGVAHDFNNMLGVIQGQIELAREDLPPGSPAIERLDQALDAARRSAGLTRQLLAFARREPSSPKVIDVNARLDAVVGMLARLIGEGVDVEWRPGQGVWPVRFDPGQLDQVVANLVINARDAMQGRGTLTIRTRNVPGARLAGATVDAVELAIADTGSGMDEATRARIFEPFFTTKPQGQGTGLGLATVYGVVRQHGGVVEVDSEPGAGATFRVLLPRCPAAVEAQAPAEARSMVEARATVATRTPVETPAQPAAGQTVLVVEDEPALLKMVTSVLRRQGYVVVPAANAEQAESAARAHDGHLHLLLTDMIMPGLNGHQLWTRMRAAHPGLRCLVMSGYTRESEGMPPLEAPIILKPFSMHALVDAVRAALDGPPSPP